VSIIEADKEGSICSNATKGIAREETSVSHQGKGAGRRREAEESRGR